MNEALDEDLTVIDHLDFELECYGPGCENQPAWLVTMKCCSSEYLLCEYHREIEMRELESVPVRVCVVCKHGWNERKENNYNWVKL